VLTRVYLDQWVWIRLARAALGRPKDPQDADVLAMVRESVRLGLASYPLSPVHYKELAAGASPRQGHELAPVIPASGQTIRVEGMNFYRLKDGRVTDIWTQFDGVALLQQLGAIPA
jgi:hypothetical protein